MPRVKIEYVVSFSSEDPEHQSNNLLNKEVSKKKWLCKKGESSCSVVLQLAKAVKISAVHIGAYHAALVEVLVARSETSSEQFQVLVPSSVFISREESRRDTPVERVRSFSAEQLSASTRDQRWDRVRVVCSQPYNKHCMYGLSFVHIDEAESTSAAAVPLRLLAFDTFSSDEEEFKPGELFAKHRQKIAAGESQVHTPNNTGAQIRQATSQALKNIPESSTKLMKTVISKPVAKRDSTVATERSADRSRDTLMYADEDERPHAKIDQVVQRHKDEKDREERNKPKEKKDRDTFNNSGNKSTDEPKRTPKRPKSDSPPRNETPQRRKDGEKRMSDQKKDKEVRKRRRSYSQEKPGPSSAEPHTILAGVVLVLSGYENPRRSQVRNIALAMGARVERDWGPNCTHLICAFPNTPKLRAVRAQAGDNIPAARAEWLEECSRLRRLLPWRWYATEPKHLIKSKPEDLVDNAKQSDSRQRDQDPDSEADTDDEIEKVLQQQKKRRVGASNDNEQKQHDAAPVTTNTNNDSRILTKTSQKTRVDMKTPEKSRTDMKPAEMTRVDTKPAEKARVDTKPNEKTRVDAKTTDRTLVEKKTGDAEYDATTDEDEETEIKLPAKNRFGGALPNFFDGYTFAIDASPDDVEEMTIYVRAYGGLVLKMSDVEEGSDVDYMVRGRGGVTPAGAAGHKCVPASWLADCHAAQKLLPHISCPSTSNF